MEGKPVTLYVRGHLLAEWEKVRVEGPGKVFSRLLWLRKQARDFKLPLFNPELLKVIEEHERVLELERVEAQRVANSDFWSDLVKKRDDSVTFNREYMFE